MDFPALVALLPVVVLIAAGLLAARAQWIRATAIKDLSNLVFYVLSPALLFRTMANVHITELDFRPIAIYFLAAGLLFALTLKLYGFTTLAAARGLANTFSNNAMIGIPVVSLTYGEAGLVTLFTLISVHSLVLMSTGTVVFELAQARQFSQGGKPQNLWRTVWQAIRNSIVHPIPIPIIAGLLYGQTGWDIPVVLDKPMLLLGQSLGPVALVLVGVTLGHSKMGHLVLPGLRIALAKTVAMPIIFLTVGTLMGLQGLPLAVMAIAAGLPVGANVYMFAQRYGVAQDEITASIAISTGLCVISLPVLLLILQAYFV